MDFLIRFAELAVPPHPPFLPPCGTGVSPSPTAQPHGTAAAGLAPGLAAHAAGSIGPTTGQGSRAWGTLPSYPNSVPLRLVAEAAWEEPSWRFGGTPGDVLAFQAGPWLQSEHANKSQQPWVRGSPSNGRWRSPPSRGVGAEHVVKPHG